MPVIGILTLPICLIGFAMVVFRVNRIGSPLLPAPGWRSCEAMNSIAQYALQAVRSGDDVAALYMFSVDAMQKQAGTRVVGCLRSAHDVVEFLFAQRDRLGSLVGCLTSSAGLLVHDVLQCCAGCDAVACYPHAR